METINVKRAIDSVLKDEGFTTPSENARTVLTFAGKVSKWISDTKNEAAVQLFSTQLLESLNGCFPPSDLKFQREKMWSNFHSLQLSGTFLELWKHFLQLVGVDSNPLFYQHVTDVLFQEIISKHCTVDPGQPATSRSTCSVPLTYEECNALRYVAGYVCKKIETKIRSSKHPHREDILLCFMDIEDEDSNASCSADWVQTVDRGGLCRISEDTYMVFLEIEQNVPKYLSMHSVQQHKLTSNLREKVKESALNDVDVRFYWCMVACEIEEEPGEILLEMLIDLYVTIRGFSFVKSVIEQYKQAQKKSTQKSKALRKNLLPASK